MPEEKSPGIFGRVVRWFKHAAEWVPEHLGDPDFAGDIRADLGLSPGDAIPEAKKDEFARYGAGLDPDKEAFEETVAQITEIVPVFLALKDALGDESESAPGLIFYTIMQAVAADSVRTRDPALYEMGKLVGFAGDDREWLAYIDPAVMVRNLQGKDLPSGEVWAQRISVMAPAVAVALDWAVRKVLPKGEVDAYYGWDPAPDSPAPLADFVSERALTMNIGKGDGDGARCLLTLLGVPEDHGGWGLFVSVGGALSADAEVPLDHPDGPEDAGRSREGRPMARYELDVGAADGFNFFVRFQDPHDFTPDGDPAAFLRFIASYHGGARPAFRIGDADKTHLDLQDLEWGVDLSPERAGFRFGLREAALVIRFKEADGFIQSVAGQETTIKFGAALAIDSEGGWRLEGGTGVHVTIPVGGSIGGVLIVHQLELGLEPPKGDIDLTLELAGGFSFKLGPFAASVDRLGFRLDATFPKNGDGNLGVADLVPRFRPPSGIGLRLDAGVVRGGGYLYLDPDKGEYAGALELACGALALKAIGILTTRAPDGTDRWSLLLLVYAQFPPTPIVFGFTLNGVGGMIGIQHAVDIDALGAGMRTGVLDDILFPNDPVGDAPRIINRLRAVFPPTTGALTLGPMLDLGWGTPRIVWLRLGVILQIDNVFAGGAVSFSKLVLVGQLKVVVLPAAAEKITPIKLLVDILGFWDFDQKRLGFMARLRDSRVGTVDIAGTIAVYGEYGASSRFLLAAGGFNPRFKDVPALVAGGMDRLSGAFRIGPLRVVLSGYFAITPATVQLGAALTASGTFGPVGLEGEIGFDAICYFEPAFYFIIDFRVRVAVKFKGHSLASVKFTGSVEGPGRWVVDGEVSFSILFWDVDKSIHAEWGTREALANPPVNIQQALAADLERPSNWTAQLPAGGESIVTLAPPAETEAALAHPLGRLAFSQRTAPLGLRLERYGNAAVEGPDRFDVQSVRAGGAELAYDPVREQFARAQFVDMSEEDKLAKPSFEPLDAGVAFASEDFDLPDAAVVDLEAAYELVYLQEETRYGFRLERIALADAPQLQAEHARHFARYGAAAVSPLRAEEEVRRRQDGRIAVAAPPLAVASRETMAAVDTVALDGAARRATMAAEQALRAAGDGGAQLVEAFELVEA
jgi:hypothetical protein